MKLSYFRLFAILTNKILYGPATISFRRIYYNVYIFGGNLYGLQQQYFIMDHHYFPLSRTWKSVRLRKRQLRYFTAPYNFIQRKRQLRHLRHKVLKTGSAVYVIRRIFFLY